jgi:hypothetical protein
MISINKAHFKDETLTNVIIRCYLCDRRAGTNHVATTSDRPSVRPLPGRESVLSSFYFVSQ